MPKSGCWRCGGSGYYSEYQHGYYRVGTNLIGTTTHHTVTKSCGCTEDRPIKWSEFKTVRSIGGTSSWWFKCIIFLIGATPIIVAIANDLGWIPLGVRSRFEKLLARISFPPLDK